MPSPRSSRLLPLIVLCLALGGGCKSTPGPAVGAGGAATGSGGQAVGTGGGIGTGAGPSAGGSGPAAGGTAAGGTSADGGNVGSGGSGGNVTAQRTFVYVGSGDFGDAEPGLITVYELDRMEKTLAFVSEHPAGRLASYLAIDAQRMRLFAGDEADGGVHSFAIAKATGQLTSLGHTPADTHPVYLSLTSDGQHILAANYNEGSVDVYPIDSAGKAGSSLGATPTGAQAHSVVLGEDGHVYVPNKGADTISLLEFDGEVLAEGLIDEVSLASPRHLFLHGGRAYVVSEEADLITAYDAESDGSLAYLWDVPRLPAGEGNAATDTGADVRVTPSGKFLYATNRGSHNSVVAYDLQTTPPTLLEHESSLGTTPRNFAMDPEEEFIIVANHGSTKTLVLFTIEADGRLTPRVPLALDFSPYVVLVAQFP